MNIGTPRTRMIFASLVTAGTVVAISVGAHSLMSLDPAVSSAQVAATEQDALRISEMLFGTRAQRDDEQRLVYSSFQGRIVECMTKKGYSYTPPPFESQRSADRPQEIYSGIDAFAPLVTASTSTLGVGDSLSGSAKWRIDNGMPTLGAESPNPGFDMLDSAGKQAYLFAIDSCEPSAQEIERYESGAAVAPPLSSNFEAILEEAASTSAARSLKGSYPTCMRAAGHAVSSRAELLDALRVRYEKILAEEGLQAALEPSAAWGRLRSEEQAATTADTQCRRKAYVAAMTALRAPLTEFGRVREQELHTQQQRLIARTSKADGAMTALDKRVRGDRQTTGAQRP